MKPNFIGLGAQKCASSWLYVVCREHPEVYVSTPKELDFFSCFYDRGFQWYENYFTGAPPRGAVGEISPSYLPDFDAPARAYAYNPTFRIIVALRDPLERAYSNHLHELRLGQYAGSDLSFEAGLANNPMYVEQSRYATHLSRWLKVFPKHQLLVVLQEDINSDPRREARRLYEFLDVDSRFVSTSAETRENESYLPRSRGREQLVRALGSGARRVGMSAVVDLLRKTGFIAALHARNRLKIRELVPPMRETTREHLYRVLGDECLELAAMIGRDSLPWETWKSAVARRRAS